MEWSSLNKEQSQAVGGGASAEWTIRAFKALDTESKGYLLKKDLLQVLKD